MHFDTRETLLVGVLFKCLRFRSIYCLERFLFFIACRYKYYNISKHECRMNGATKRSLRLRLSNVRALD